MPKVLFIGVNNRKDPTALDMEKGECEILHNVDPDNEGGFATRVGAVQVVPTAIRSSWSNGSVAYLDSGAAILRFPPPPAAAYSIGSIPQNDLQPCVFEEVNDVVVVTNGLVYKVIDGGVLTDPVPKTDTFMRAPTPGHCLAFYNTRMYIGVENFIECTIPFSVETCDTRACRFPVTQDEITAIIAVRDGLFVGTTRETFFLRGGDPFEGEGFVMERVASYGIVRGTARKVKSEQAPVAQAAPKEEVAIWASAQGICIGGPDGAYLNVSATSVSIPEASSGASMVREQGGLVHFIAALSAGTAYNAYVPPTLEIDEL